ncbi:MAG: 50S ribosomal protein L6 [Veillonella sp.]|nr:50S ribosomal protein L6 [Veillonella sp.]
MSRKGNKILSIPSGVTVTVQPDKVEIKGPKGTLNVKLPNTIEVKVENNGVKVSRKNDEKQTRQFHGTINSLINNAIIGVSTGYTIKLNIVGVGYKAQVSGNKFKLNIGFSHPVEFEVPAGVKVTCPTPTQVEITGYDKIIVGEFAANIRAVRKPEPYNGKGIMYEGEHIIRKVGKTAEAAKK